MEAARSILSPVRGLRTFLAFLSRVPKTPKPNNCTFEPSTKALVTVTINVLITIPTSYFVRPVLPAIFSISSFLSKYKHPFYNVINLAFLCNMQLEFGTLHRFDHK